MVWGDGTKSGIDPEATRPIAEGTNARVSPSLIVTMERPSKKEIKAALDKLRSNEGGNELPETPTPALQPKKTNKNGIRKKGV